MTLPASTPGTFRDHLDEVCRAGGMAADVLVQGLLPLFRQVLQQHEAGRVAPLEGLADLKVMEGRIFFESGKARPPRTATARLGSVDAPPSRALDIVGELRRTLDLPSGEGEVRDLRIGRREDPVERPVFLPGYVSWEHLVDHHDPLTDIYILGLLTASLALGLDLDRPEDLERFVRNRDNLFTLRPDLNPVIGRVIVGATEVSRRRRAQDLALLVQLVENFREQDLALLARSGTARPPGGGSRAVLAPLKERLFEISRRNRLLYFRPTLGTLDLTAASVPLSFSVEHILPEQLFTWNATLEQLVKDGDPIPLGRYLQFEQAPYLPGVLTRILGEARRDQKEFGSSQLRLVICFLRWHDLKEAKAERIHSPLLLLPVQLARRKGVRDAWLLEVPTAEAQVNPVLRYHLRQLYGIDLPESVDLSVTSVTDLHARIAREIQASEPGVTLDLVEKPQVKLLHDKARRRLEQFLHRQRLSGRGVKTHGTLDYSYRPENFKPLGLGLFTSRVRPSPAPTRGLLSTCPRVFDYMVDNEEERERTFASFQESASENPYRWELDLCHLTLGNFRYRKLSLVRDYEELEDRAELPASLAALLSTGPRPSPEPAEPLPLAEQSLVVDADPTQQAAIAWSRRGVSFVIQGPPGTGKSQTITNLIADYVARGKRVLFVCQKRAALDVVHHRLRQHGLGGLVSLVHDAQEDRRGFIMGLKEAYESRVGPAAVPLEGVADERRRLVKELEGEMAPLASHGEALGRVAPEAGMPVVDLVERVLETRDVSAGNAEVPGECPPYRHWHDSRDRLVELLERAGEVAPGGILARHPLVTLGAAVLEAERPEERVRSGLESLRESLHSLRFQLATLGEKEDVWEGTGTLRELAGRLETLAPLLARRMVDVLDPGSPRSVALEGEVREIARRERDLEDVRKVTARWRRKLEDGEARVALDRARELARAFLPALRPGWWQLRGVLQERYDFAAHAVEPTWVQILEPLVREYELAGALRRDLAELGERLGFTGDGGSSTLRQYLEDIRRTLNSGSPRLRDFHRRRVSVSPPDEGLRQEAGPFVAALARLESTAAGLLEEIDDLPFAALEARIAAVEVALDGLPRWLPCLEALQALPAPLARALRTLDRPAAALEAAMARGSLERLLERERVLAQVDGTRRMRHESRLREAHDRWTTVNARHVHERVVAAFREKVRVSELAAGSRTGEDAAERRAYRSGRKELEHEFGKTMRYRAVRDLLSGPSGEVLLDLEPIWLMSPLSVSDVLPLGTRLFDVVIFDEASQIPLEEALPSACRADQIVVVGDERQLPPTSFFSRKEADDDESDDASGFAGLEALAGVLESESFLEHAARTLPATTLGWHYRSRSEALIAYSNAAFYEGSLLTVPDRAHHHQARPEIVALDPARAADSLAPTLARSLSFHHLPRARYVDRRNPDEARYIAGLVRALLAGGSGLTVGIVAFSEAQQGEIESALEALADEDADFRGRLEAEYERMEDGQFCGLLVKNLENMQGDERDLVILSVCYGPGPDGTMRMGFGPINQAGGERRLNVAFSRAKRHMAVVSSIEPGQITNLHNDGARCLQGYLAYARAISSGEVETAARFLEAMRPRSASGRPVEGARRSAVREALAAALRDRGHQVVADLGYSRFRCDLAVRSAGARDHQLALFVDEPGDGTGRAVLESALYRPRLLEAFGWRRLTVGPVEWYRDPAAVLERIERVLSEAVAAEATPVPAVGAAGAV